jgi:hypothetical protein
MAFVLDTLEMNSLVIKMTLNITKDLGAFLV